jgi:hypothetical protein
MTLAPGFTGVWIDPLERLVEANMEFVNGNLDVTTSLDKKFN